jgi:aryl sulfotransferase
MSSTDPTVGPYVVSPATPGRPRTGNTVWLASYPKSGNTWFRAVFTAWQTGQEVDLNQLGTKDTSSIASSRMRIEEGLGVVSSLLTADEVEQLRPRADDMADASYDSPHLCKVHDALFRGSAGEFIVSVAATRCAVYVVRDPRDVALSYANHNQWDVARVVAEMNDENHCMSPGTSAPSNQVRQRLGTWSQHVTSWLNDAPFDVHVVRYEDCITDPVATFTTALRFAGFDADEASVAAAVDLTTFDRLAAQEATDGFRERPAGTGRFFRRGEAGGWHDELDADLAAVIADDHGAVMRRLGYLGDAWVNP